MSDGDEANGSGGAGAENALSSGEGAPGSSSPPVPQSPIETIPAATTALEPSGVTRGAVGVLLALGALNVLGAADRWVFAAVLPRVQEARRLVDEEAVGLATWYLIGLMVAAPALGLMGDRVRRPRLLALAVGLWGLAVIGSGLARTASELRLARGLAGAGAGAFLAVAPTVLADLFPRGARARVMTGFFLALPIGGTLAAALVEGAGPSIGWSSLLIALGLPAALLAPAVLWLPEPPRGLSEGVAVERLRAHERAGASQEDYLDLMVNSSYAYSVLGMAFHAFALAGLATWLPRFLAGVKGFDPGRATALVLWGTVLGAGVGMSAGGWLGDRLARVYPRALFVLSGLAMLAAFPFLLGVIHGPGGWWVLAAVACAEALMFAHVGPCHAVIAFVALPNLRSAAFGVALGAGQVLGGLWAPGLMAWVADTFGRADAMMTPFGRALAALGAVPTARAGGPSENLSAAMLVVLPALVLSGVMFLAGARHLPREMALMLAQLKALPRSHARAAPRAGTGSGNGTGPSPGAAPR